VDGGNNEKSPAYPLFDDTAFFMVLNSFLLSCFFKTYNLTHVFLFWGIFCVREASSRTGFAAEI